MRDDPIRPRTNRLCRDNDWARSETAAPFLLRLLCELEHVEQRALLIREIVVGDEVEPDAAIRHLARRDAFEIVDRVEDVEFGKAAASGLAEAMVRAFVDIAHDAGREVRLVQLALEAGLENRDGVAGERGGGAME